jgi:16S rRNA (guanine(966)-N(2))-methyltransferase RsmD
MRIITGRFKGVRVSAPAGSAVRPTSDGLRETLFNVLQDTVAAKRVLDAFAGTGALGLEALSRGAAHVTFIERDPRVLRVLKENVTRCRAEDACAIIRDDFLHARRAPEPFDLILIDPPYDIEDLAQVVEIAATLAAPGGQVVLEHARRRESPPAVGSLVRTRVLVAGDSALSFYA